MRTRTDIRLQRRVRVGLAVVATMLAMGSCQGAEMSTVHGYRRIPLELVYLKSLGIRFGKWYQLNSSTVGLEHALSKRQIMELATGSNRFVAEGHRMVAAGWFQDQDDQLQIGSHGNVSLLLDLMDELGARGLSPFRENRPHHVRLPPVLKASALPDDLQYLLPALQKYGTLDLCETTQLTPEARSELTKIYEEIKRRGHWPIAAAWPTHRDNEESAERSALCWLHEVIETFEINGESDPLEALRPQVLEALAGADSDGDNEQSEDSSSLIIAPPTDGLPDPIDEFDELIGLLCDPRQPQSRRYNAAELLVACSADSTQEARTIVSGTLRVLLNWDDAPPSSIDQRQQLWRKCIRLSHAWGIGGRLKQDLADWIKDSSPPQTRTPRADLKSDEYLCSTLMRQRMRDLMREVQEH